MSENVAAFPVSEGETPSQEASAQDASAPQDVGGVAGQRLNSFIERIERLEEEKTALMEDIKEFRS